MDVYYYRAGQKCFHCGEDPVLYCKTCEVLLCKEHEEKCWCTGNARVKAVREGPSGEEVGEQMRRLSSRESVPGLRLLVTMGTTVYTAEQYTALEIPYRVARLREKAEEMRQKAQAWARSHPRTFGLTSDTSCPSCRLRLLGLNVRFPKALPMSEAYPLEIYVSCSKCGFERVLADGVDPRQF